MPCQISTVELLGPNGLEKTDAEGVIGLVAELPDLWYVALASWENDSQTFRFGPEGRQEPFIFMAERLAPTRRVRRGPRSEGSGKNPGRKRRRARSDRSRARAPGGTMTSVPNK